MKTQLIQLDPSDDFISVRDKMGWSQTSRILLVWPEHGQILSRRLDLVLLQRHSASLGAQLALVTRSPHIREVARDLRLQVFDTPRQAQNVRWRSNRRRRSRPFRRNPPPDVVNLRLQLQRPTPTWQDHPIARISLFGLSLAAIIILMLFFVPAAQITLQPETREQSVTLPVKAGPGFASVNLAGELPVTMQSVVVEGREQIPTTGSILIPGEPASGAVRFTNLTAEPIRIPAGLIVTTLEAAPKRFATTREGMAGAGPGNTTTIPVRAVVPGETGNLPAASLVAIEGELGLRLSVTNPYATHGGTDVSAPAPTAQDRRSLSERLTATLRTTALADMQDSLAEGDLLLTTTLELANVLEEIYAPTAGLPGDQLELTLRLEFQAMVVKAADLQALVLPVLEGSLPSGFISQGEAPVLSHTAFSSPDEDMNIAWNITARRNLQAEIKSDTVIQSALGQPAKTIADSLEASLPVSDTPEIQLSPTWWPRLPFLAFRIQVSNQ